MLEQLIIFIFSPAFLPDEMIEKKSSEVHMHEIDPSALELLVEYTYTSQIIISESNVQVHVFHYHTVFSD